MLASELSSNLLEIPKHAYHATLTKSDWLFNSQTSVPHADCMILDNNEKATLLINLVPYYLDTSTYNQQPYNNNGFPHEAVC